MSSRHVLLAEDDASAAQELTELLQRLGYHVIAVVTTGTEAVRQTESLHPDIVLMNVRLKGRRDGIQTGSLLRTQHDVPLVYLVDYSSQETIRRATHTGPLGYIFRPFDEKQIYATIETALVRHQLESELRQSRQWLNTTLTSIGDGVVATDEHGLIRFLNPVATELTGWSQAEAIGKLLYEVLVLVEECSHSMIDLSKTASNSSNSKSLEALLLRRTGASVPVQANATPIQDEIGTVHGMVVVFRDISRQRQALQEIRRQADRAEALMQVASELNSELELELVLSTICQIMNRTLQADGAAVVLLDPQKERYRVVATASQESSLRAYLETQFEVPKEMIQAVLSREKPVHLVPHVKALSSSPYFDILKRAEIHTLALAALFRSNTVTGALVVAFTHEDSAIAADEIALFKGLADQASNAIQNAELFRQVRVGRDRQRKLAKSLVDVQEAERRHLAKELHDHLGQVLTGLQFSLQTAKNQASEGEHAKLAEIQNTVTDIIRQIREMSLNLRPAMLDDMGLLPTLHWHIDRFTSQTGIQVSLQCDERLERLPIEIEIAAYRIIQEALTNVARHAEVSEVLLGVTKRNEALWIEVRDHGKGFDPYALLHEPSSGLGSMRERANLVGGYLGIKSSPNQGAQVIAVLPLTEKHVERREHERQRPLSG